MNAQVGLFVSRRKYVPITIIAIAVAVAIPVLAIFVTAGPRVTLCEQGALSKRAGLIAEAQDAYRRATAAGNSCPTGKRAEVNVLLAKASSAFGRGEAEARAERTAAAIHAYVTGLEFDPANKRAIANLGEQLAPEGSRATTGVKAGSGCKWARRLIGAGVLDKAGAALAVGNSPASAACPKTLDDLATAYEKASFELSRAEELNEEGRSAPARKAYAAALETNGGLGEARTGLEGSLGNESNADEVGSWLTGVPTSLETALNWFIPLAIALLLLAVLVWTGLRTLASVWPWGRRALECVGDHAGLSLLRKVAQPSLSVEIFEGGESREVGRAFSTLLAQALPLKAGQEAEFAFDRVATGSGSDQAAAKDIGDLAKDIPQAKLVGTVLQYAARLFRRRVIKIQGHLIPEAGDRGVGVALSIKGNGMGSECTQTIWGEEFDPHPGGEGDIRWLRLVPVATVWARRQLQEEMNPPEEPKPDGWLADALFQAGVQWQAQDDLNRAEALYSDALEKDPGLLPAMHNLAVIDVHNGQYRQAMARLKRLREQLGEREDSGVRWPSLATGHQYTQVLALLYNETEKEDLRAARVSTIGLIRQLDSEIAAGNASDTDVRELEAALDPSVALLASVTVECDTSIAEEAAEQLTGKESAIPAPPDRSDRISRKKLIENLDAWHPQELVDRYLLARPHPSRRTLYNLACYYTKLAELVGWTRKSTCFKFALAALELAVEGGELVEWARRDPSLELLRKKKRTEFEHTLERHEVTPHSTPSGEKGQVG